MRIVFQNSVGPLMITVELRHLYTIFFTLVTIEVTKICFYVIFLVVSLRMVNDETMSGFSITHSNFTIVIFARGVDYNKRTVTNHSYR